MSADNPPRSMLEHARKMGERNGYRAKPSKGAVRAARLLISLDNDPTQPEYGSLIAGAAEIIERSTKAGEMEDLLRRLMSLWNREEDAWRIADQIALVNAYIIQVERLLAEIEREP